MTTNVDQNSSKTQDSNPESNAESTTESSSEPNLDSSTELNPNPKFVSVVHMDKRGQVVLGKETRETAKINGGDKFAVFTIPKSESSASSLLFVKIDEILDMKKAIPSALGMIAF